MEKEILELLMKMDAKMDEMENRVDFILEETTEIKGTVKKITYTQKELKEILMKMTTK